MKKWIFSRMTPQADFVIFSFLFSLLFISCDKEVIPLHVSSSSLTTELKKPETPSAEKTNTFYGPAQPYGNGVVRAFVTMSHANEPTAIGLMISEKAFESLPDEMTNTTFQLPNQAEGLSFDHIDLGWNPHGHEPEGVYTFPHFDIHFYMISQEQQMDIVDPVKAEILPASQYRPVGYFPTPGYVPMMGKHWLNGASPELNGDAFTQTFIYGSYDGSFIFYEPMITLAYFMDKTSTEYPINQPAEFQSSGYYYPTTYSINYDSTRKVYTVVLSGLVLR